MQELGKYLYIAFGSILRYPLNVKWKQHMKCNQRAIVFNMGKFVTLYNWLKRFTPVDPKRHGHTRSFFFKSKTGEWMEQDWP